MGKFTYSYLALLAAFTLTLSFVHAQDQSAGFISLDCGLPANSSYTDKKTGLYYTSDATLIDTGKSRSISPELRTNDLDEQLKNVRSFPEGTRNCYYIKLNQGTKYLIRGTFMYGNYDAQDKLPEFDLGIGANIRESVKLDDPSTPANNEIIHVPSSNYVHVCLVNTGNGTPFISALELRPLPSDLYETKLGSLALFLRLDIGSITNQTFRYDDDIYDRIWAPATPLLGTTSVNTSQTIDPFNSFYKPPSDIMCTAATPVKANDPLYFSLDYGNTTFKYYVYMHFAEVKELQANQSREFNIYLNGDFWYGPFVPRYLSPITVYTPANLSGGKYEFSINKTKKSTLPPILNAIEVYKVIELPLSETDQEDVSAITTIKSIYNVKKNWQGDPCTAEGFMWDGLTCTYKGFDPPRIVSLNLSSNGLTGEIPPSISNLTVIQSLDLSNNSLTGGLPDFLSQLPSLRVLNLERNQLTGSVPTELLEKSKKGSLSLSLEDNPKLCQTDSCNKQHKKFPILIIATIVLVLIIILSALAIFWRIKKKRHEGEKEMKQKMLIQELGGHFTKKGKVVKDGQTSHDVQFLSFESITSATNNFSTQNKLGEGGFGPVYKGKLLDGQEIAIKRLSRSSGQGLVEFKNEALLIAKLQHANLVRLLGFCIQEEEKLLIYEYMANKSLDFFLFDSTKKKLLTWKIRFNIIEGVAQGLVYLHKYSRPRVIHRDLKASNILLDNEMNPKISDFGMARIFGLNDSEEMTNRVVGTYGYMSPEYAISGVVSVKTDVFSFGVLLLEIVSGKKNNSHYHYGYSINLIGYTWQLWNEDRGLELIDPTLDESCPPNEALRCIHTGLLCVQDHATDRPTMLEAVSMLSNDTVQLTPPKQPAFLINTVVEDPEVPEIQPESCSINNVTISVLETR